MLFSNMYEIFPTRLRQRVKFHCQTAMFNKGQT